MEGSSTTVKEIQDWVKSLAKARFSYLVNRGVEREMAKKEALTLANRLLEAFEDHTLSYLGRYEETELEGAGDKAVSTAAATADFEQGTLWDA